MSAVPRLKPEPENRPRGFGSIPSSKEIGSNSQLSFFFFWEPAILGSDFDSYGNPN